MEIALNSHIQEICRVLNRAGHTVYMVGGCLRDQLLGRQIHDFDLASTALPEQICQLFPKVIKTGIQHGTVTVLINNSGYEITTLRGDGIYKDGRHPEKVFFTKDINEDLARRDFTINAMAYKLPDGPLFDPFGGRGDLAKGLIRAVNEPQKRFSEDGLRLLRAARFAAKLGFAIEPETLTAIKSCSFMATKVSAERLSSEFCQLLTAKDPAFGLTVLQESTILAQLWPELADLPASHFATLRQYEPVLLQRLGQLLRPLPAEPFNTVKSLKLPTVFSKRLLRLWQLLQKEPVQTAPAGRAFIAQNEDLLTDYLALIGQAGQNIARLAQNEPVYNEKNLALGSQKLLLFLGLKPGPLLGEIRRFLLQAVWQNPALNTEEQLLALVKDSPDSPAKVLQQDGHGPQAEDKAENQ